MARLEWAMEQSPRGANDAQPAKRRRSEEASSSQQCSADPNAFFGLRRSVVMAAGAANDGATTSMRLALRLDEDDDASVSTLSQINRAASQQPSEYHGLFEAESQTYAIDAARLSY
ncbi:hypothetical protein ATCC90586_007831 [Pythium insidiosum]|nr:hypothetical protein ATCC90586_007831 [Pythium insidiosum]